MATSNDTPNFDNRIPTNDNPQAPAEHTNPISYRNREIERLQAELQAAREQVKGLQPLRDAATRAYNCLDAIYETFDGDLGIGLSRAIPGVCDEIKAALQQAQPTSDLQVELETLGNVR